MTPSEFSLNVFENATENNGGTYDVYKQEVCDYNKGFFVAKWSCEERTSNLTERFIGDFISFYKLDEYGDGLLGVWYNKEDSLWYLDVVDWWKGEGIAKIRAKQNKQLAYWDCEKNMEIRI